MGGPNFSCVFRSLPPPFFFCLNLALYIYMYVFLFYMWVWLYFIYLRSFYLKLFVLLCSYLIYLFISFFFLAFLLRLLMGFIQSLPQVVWNKSHVELSCIILFNSLSNIHWYLAALYLRHTPSSISYSTFWLRQIKRKFILMKSNNCVKDYIYGDILFK